MAYQLQILHTSDWEAGLKAVDRAGNFAAIVDRLEDSTPNSITLSTGDGWIPSPFYIAGGDAQMNATYRGVYNQYFGLSGPDAYQALTASAGRADITIQNFIGVQAAVFGNHEFDGTPTEVRNIVGANLGSRPGAADDVWVGSFFPYLSTNLNFSRDTGTSGTADLVTSTTAPNAGFALTGPTTTQTGTGADKIAKSTVIEENGERILFVGATTQLNPLLTSLGNVTIDGFSGRDDIPLLAQQINAEIDAALAANPGINKVIVGTHLQQLANEQALAPLLRNADVLIYGGSHVLSSNENDRLLAGESSANPYPQIYTNASGQPIALVGTASEYSYVGRLNVTFDDDGVIIPSSILTGGPATGAGQSGAVAVDDQTVLDLYGSRAAAYQPGSKAFLVQQVIEGLDANNDGVQETLGIADIIRQQDGNILGRSKVYLEGRRTEVRTEETNFGNLSADANLWYARQFDSSVTVSIKNGGGMRDSIGSVAADASEQPPLANPSAGKQAGDISQLDVTNSLRFNNNLSIVTVTASELERILEHGVAATAPGATPGQFAQIGGIQFSFDPTRTSQQLDSQGQVVREGQRIVSAAIVDDAGQVVDVLVRDGALVGDANRDIRVVTLDFLANPSSAAPGLGGDNYPFPAFGSDRLDLRGATGTVPNASDFAAQGSEQDALAEFLRANFSTTPFDVADTTPAGDTRISNLSVRSDVALDSDLRRGSDTAPDTMAVGPGNDVLNGGAGWSVDTLVFNSKAVDATIVGTGPDGITILNNGSRDTVAGFERFQFTDRTIDVRDGSPLVDDLFYSLSNKDVLAAGIDPEKHYLEFGAREGRDPNPYFDTSAYLDFYPDVARAKVDPLEHYHAFGWKEGRDPSAAFDTSAYLAAYADVARAGVDPLQHFLEFGQAEGRKAFASDFLI